MAQERRICWPDFDATCLEGGCVYCNDNPFRKVVDISRRCENNADLPNRGNGTTTPARDAFAWGWAHGWCNAEVRDIN
jgi:hypothetical protein